MLDKRLAALNASAVHLLESLRQLLMALSDGLLNSQGVVISLVDTNKPKGGHPH